MDWPEVPEQVKTGEIDLHKVILEGRVKEVVAEAEAARASVREAETLRRQTEKDLLVERHKTSDASFAAFEAEVRGVAKAGIDRARSGAEFVEKAAAGVVTLYTGLLALVFSTDHTPLPSRAVIPAIFLGLSIAFAFAYLAFIKDPGLVTLPPPQATLRKEAEERLWFFVEWIRSGIVNKKSAIRLSVFLFAAGILTLPFPFMAAPTQEATASNVAFEWPTPAPVSAEIELQKVVYQAQIEVAKQELVESAKYTRPPEDEALFWVAGVGLILVSLFGVSYWNGRDDDNYVV